jgi:hypothetical protein
MDAEDLFEPVLDPDERLLWSGVPRKLILTAAAVNFALLTVLLGYICGKMTRLRTAPFSAGLKVEVILVAFMFLALGYTLGRRVFRSWKTVYAVTDRRLWMALGPHEIRSTPLAELDAVQTEYRPRTGKVLSFRLRDESKPRVWAIKDAEKVRHLIESARSVTAP